MSYNLQEISRNYLPLLYHKKISTEEVQLEAKKSNKVLYKDEEFLTQRKKIMLIYNFKFMYNTIYGTLITKQTSPLIESNFSRTVERFNLQKELLFVIKNTYNMQKHNQNSNSVDQYIHTVYTYIEYQPRQRKMSWIR